MKHKAYIKEQCQDPAYVKAEKELQPVLDLAEDIIRLRMQRGWTQEELARRMGTGQANISLLEHGLSNPTLETLRKLSDVFDVELTIRLGSDEASERKISPIYMMQFADENRIGWTENSINSTDSTSELSFPEITQKGVAV
ncbi:MAG: helix-turn-helix domain-containing protein [Anaerolineales bacterium]